MQAGLQAGATTRGSASPRGGGAYCIGNAGKGRSGMAVAAADLHDMVTPARFERTTCPLGGDRSIQLSYGAIGLAGGFYGMPAGFLRSPGTQAGGGGRLRGVC